jgi:hypothetical protein
MTSPWSSSIQRFSAGKEAMHIYNKTNKEIVAMASLRPEITIKKPLSLERGFISK